MTGTDGGAVTVLVYHRTAHGRSIQLAYDQVSAQMRVVPGMLSNELLGSIRDDGFVVLSRWVDLQAFLTWEGGPDHRRTTAPLRPYREDRLDPPFGVYRVLASHHAEDFWPRSLSRRLGGREVPAAGTRSAPTPARWPQRLLDRIAEFGNHLGGLTHGFVPPHMDVKGDEPTDSSGNGRQR